MSILQLNNPCVKYGDTVIIYLNPKSKQVITVKSGETHQVKFGAIKHDELVGTRYGAKYETKRGYVFVLKCTPELWTLSLPHRTQILYFPDIAMVTMQLNLRPGSRVGEAGTGSGSMTHSLARTVYPHGQVFTFDFHESRVKDAKDEFDGHGLSQVITSGHRDICLDGFPIELADSLDAIFLDLPSPWDVIPSCKVTLRLGGRICCFSPCLEQVQKSCTAMRSHGFLDIVTMECILKPYDLKTMSYKKMDFSKANPSGDGDQLKAKDEEVMDEDTKETSCPVTSNEGDSDPNVKIYVSALPVIQIAGHTGFLTFASNLIVS